MSKKTINQSPTTTDTVVFDLLTPGADGCFTSDPYKVDNITISYIERDFLGGNYGQYGKNTVDPVLSQKLLVANSLACSSPTPANLVLAQQAQDALTAATQTNTFYYKDAVAVVIDDEPTLVNVGTGHFQYNWANNGGVKEGDYFICWSWRPLPAGDVLTSHLVFSLSSDPKSVVTIPTHLTPANKYGTILERYLPEMYKQYVGNADLTPDVLDRLNSAVADGFTQVENLGNQLIDLFDANAVHETLLVYLSNLFNLKLKSGDPALWRRQIKTAVPLFKRKGTFGGLEEALGAAGMSLTKFTQFWQVVSPFTWQESFKVVASPSFILAKLIIMPVDQNNFGLWLRRHGSLDYVAISSDNVIFEIDDCSLTATMVWVGDEKSGNQLFLYSGDILRVLYQYATVPAGQQSVENYIKNLPLADVRDEYNQDWPPKNWNVRLIEEDDPLFSVIVPVRQPFYEDVIFGQVRTEFPFSENIYNMEEYNGSTRDTVDPCLMDKAFIDPCGACVSSKFSLDVAVRDISDDRIAEVRDVLREYLPFHAVPQQLNFAGEIEDFLLPPVESISFLISLVKQEFMLGGEADPFFTRIMADGLTTSKITRNQLASQATTVALATGTEYNDFIGFISPENNLEFIGLDPNNHILEVLSPSSNAGPYVLSNLDGNTAKVSGVSEPLNQGMFTFNLSNVTYSTSVAVISQDDLFLFSDGDFASLGVKTVWDVAHTPNYTGGAWSVKIPAYGSFQINKISSDNTLTLLDPGHLLPVTNTSGVTYSLVDDVNKVILRSNNGKLAVKRRALVDLNIVNITQYVSLGGYYLLYNGIEYSISGLSGNNFYIDGYSLGMVVGANIKVKKRLLTKAIGYFSYAGLKLNTSVNYEASLGILNGSNPPAGIITDNSLFKENFMVLIGSDYYKIEQISGTTITLGGLPYDIGTLGAGGRLVSFSISKFTKNSITITGLSFDQVDRRGKDVAVEQVLTLPSNLVVMALSLPEGSNVQDNMVQNEEVEFDITYRGVV